MSNDDTLQKQLSELEPVKLIFLINLLIKKQPHLEAAILEQLIQWQAEESGCAPIMSELPIHLDTKAIQQLVRHGGDIESLLATVPQYLSLQQGHTALILLEAVTVGLLEVALATFHKISQDKASHADFVAQANYIRLLSDMSELWADSFLKTVLSHKSRQLWQQKLTVWQAQLAHYMVYVFDTALDALQFNWDYLPLQQILQGQTQQPLWQESNLLADWTDEQVDTGQPYDADALINRYLRILKEQGRYQEYLYLAQADGRDYESVMMLLQLGQVTEAIKRYREGLYAETEINQLRSAFAQVGEMI
ncbi:hypothetical protein BegalDRAFT_1250 [Beggiatoa alba B18LD]|uniref:Uncharacterized protein n=1 Tax=Beggiatoa alba B18LD TaxID=395493 RepID=I3CEV6_9GAMM|nr:hypothetical protein [Beggiatoa alba]EIJ42149.1 hypothetical protein BegalDRAFT_1250 [Beggiatoa alba B18LD]